MRRCARPAAVHRNALLFLYVPCAEFSLRNFLHHQLIVEYPRVFVRTYKRIQFLPIKKTCALVHIFRVCGAGKQKLIQNEGRKTAACARMSIVRIHAALRFYIRFAAIKQKGRYAVFCQNNFQCLPVCPAGKKRVRRKRNFLNAHARIDVQRKGLRRIGLRSFVVHPTRVYNRHGFFPAEKSGRSVFARQKTKNRAECAHTDNCGCGRTQKTGAQANCTQRLVKMQCIHIVIIVAADEKSINSSKGTKNKMFFSSNSRKAGKNKKFFLKIAKPEFTRIRRDRNFAL